jgi:hypothetical protein
LNDLMNTERTYMDWNATAPLLDEAREAFLRVGLMNGNPSSVHREGRAVRAEIEAVKFRRLPKIDKRNAGDARIGRIFAD